MWCYNLRYKIVFNGIMKLIFLHKRQSRPIFVERDGGANKGAAHRNIASTRKVSASLLRPMTKELLRCAAPSVIVQMNVLQRLGGSAAWVSQKPEWHQSNQSVH
jgi:hypothetical protein